MTDMKKVNDSNPTRNVVANINPNGFVIVPTSLDYMSLDSPAQNDAVFAVSGVIAERFDDITYYTT